MTEKFSLGQLVSFSEKRGTLRYKLAPYNEKARDRDATFPEGSIDFSNAEGAIVNVEHDPFRPIGKLSDFESKPDGLYATVTLANTTLGRDIFTEAKEGLRTGVSMELSEMTPTSGTITSAVLSGAGIVVNPALGSARLISAFSEDSTPEEETTSPSEPEQPEEEITAEAEAEAETPTESEDEMSETPAAVPTATTKNFANQSLREVASVFASRDARLVSAMEDAGALGENQLFALTNITNTAHKDNVEQPAWLGELWSGKDYQRKYVPLVGSGSLTSWKVEGFKWTALPTVGDYAGDLADIPSTGATSTYYSTEASRLAGGVKVDRKFVDFGNTDTIASLLKGAATDYARKSDAKVINFIKANAQAVSAGSVPTGVAAAAAKIVDGSLAMIDFATPSFAIVGTAAYRDLLLTKENDSLKYLESSLGLEDGSLAGFKIIPSADVAANDVYVGAREAVTFYELGGSPIRVEAIDVNKGGFDEALFGYYALVLNDARGLKKVG
ncbi:phage major capsid protein [Pseudarthrobacter sp. alpha12b]